VVHTFWPVSRQLPSSCLHGRKVRARGGLGEELAPDLVAVEHRAEIARLLLLGAVGDDRRPEHPHPDRVEDPRNPRAGDLLVADHLLDRAHPLAAILLRPGHAGEARLGELALPCAARGEYLRLVLECPRAVQDRRLGLVLLQPAAHLGAVGGLLGCVVEIHGFSFG
jgi:hypothetical protein